MEKMSLWRELRKQHFFVCSRSLNLKVNPRIQEWEIQWVEKKTRILLATPSRSKQICLGEIDSASKKQRQTLKHQISFPLARLHLTLSLQTDLPRPRGVLQWVWFKAIWKQLGPAWGNPWFLLTEDTPAALPCCQHINTYTKYTHWSWL